jgi:hypothetical protein
MPLKLFAPRLPVVDLTVPPELGDAAVKLARAPVLADDLRAIEVLGAEESPRRRMPLLSDTFRKLETDEAARLLRAAGGRALEHDPAAVRMLFSFLEVKRPGVEVLRQLNPLTSLERVSLRLLRGTWEDTDSTAAEVVFPILETFEEAIRAGVIDVGVDRLPRKPDAMRAINRHLAAWFERQAELLEAGRELADVDMHFLTQLCMLEINLMERRVSRLASRVDPYDGRAIGRLMPVLSFYDQDIEHLKSVVGRLSTYRPFFERLLTMEHVLSSSELDRIQRVLGKDPAGRGLSQLLVTARANPILDRELAFLVSSVYQVALLRHQTREEELRPDLLTTIHQVYQAVGTEPVVHVSIEPDIAERVFAIVEDWGFVHRLPDVFVLTYREEWAGNFVLPDGTPSLPERAGEKPKPPVSVRELIQRQLSNDAFIVGILENTRITSLPGIVPMIAMHARSIRVIDKILNSRNLITGPANKDVARLILMNPTRVPVQSLKPIINVRFVSRVDLERMSRPTSEVRPEVRTEIANYLRILRTN